MFSRFTVERSLLICTWRNEDATVSIEAHAHNGNIVGDIETSPLICTWRNEDATVSIEAHAHDRIYCFVNRRVN